MKDFDAEPKPDDVPVADRQFVLRGQTFTLRDGVRPEAVVPYEDMGDCKTSQCITAALDTLFYEGLEEESAERWRLLRADKASPVRWEQLLDVGQFAYGVLAGRPTKAPASSQGGRDSTSGGSADDSSSQEPRKAA